MCKIVKQCVILPINISMGVHTKIFFSKSQQTKNKITKIIFFFLLSGVQVYYFSSSINTAHILRVKVSWRNVEKCFALVEGQILFSQEESVAERARCGPWSTEEFRATCCFFGIYYDTPCFSLVLLKIVMHLSYLFKNWALEYFWSARIVAEIFSLVK